MGRPRTRALACAALVLLSALALTRTVAAQAPAGRRELPPPAVVYITVQRQEIHQSAEFIAHVQAIQSVDIKARVDGYLDKVAFKNGQDVKKGDLLYVIEPAQYEAAVAQAKAQLASAEASLQQAKDNLTRQQQLLEHHSTAEINVEQAKTQQDVAKANVESAQAQLKTAEINLGYTRITAPIDGRIGPTAVTVGNVVGPNSGTLATIVQLEPIRVVFSVGERALVAYRQQHKQATQQEINQRFVPTLQLPDGSMYAQTGHVAFVDNHVDPSTGTLAVYAEFPNPRHLLLPGMLVSAVIRPETPVHGFLVPAGAVQQDRQGQYVLVVADGDKIERRAIKTAGQVDQSTVVGSGLNPGDRVVVEGTTKVHPGQTVNPIPESSAAGAQDQPSSAPAPSAPAQAGAGGTSATRISH